MQARTKEKRKVLTPEEQYQRSVYLKHRFKACIRLIMANVTWLQELEDDKLGDNVKKNIVVLTRKKGKKSLLTLADKGILNQPPNMRSDEQKAHLRQIFAKMKCFKRFPPDVLDELPSITYFQYWPANRILIKQGYPPMNMYVVVTGEVVVSRTHYDKVLRQDVTNDLMILGGGSIFGEVALLYDTVRTETVVTMQNSEFLYFKRDDFERVLKKTMLNLYENVLSNMKSFNYFDDWNANDLREGCILSKKKFFKEEEILLGCGTGYSDLVYFIIKGRCFLLEYMLIRTEVKNGIASYYLENFDERIDRATKGDVLRMIQDLFRKSDEEESSMDYSIRPPVPITYLPTLIETRNGKAKLYILRVATYNKMASFNYGENMKNRIIVADTDTECLLLPRYFLFSKSRITFKGVEAYLNAHVPNSRKVFKNFLQEKQWEKYKTQLTYDILKHRRISNSKNTIHNVPYTIRIGADMGELL